MIEPYYKDEYVQIYHGDCKEVLPQLKSVDLILTDPPYGVGKAEWDTAFPTDWIWSGLKLAPRMLVMTGNTALITAGAAFGPYYKDCIVLYAANGMTRSKVAFGNWVPVLAIGDWRWEARPNFIKFNVETSEKIAHPSPKPLEAVLRLMSYYTKPEWIVCDPFMGSGTTLLAAKMLGNRAIGIETEERYCELAVRRLSQGVLDFEATPVVR